MDVELSSLRWVPLLRFRGEIGNESSPRLRKALEDALPPGVNRLLLDFSAVPYIDGGCLGLVWAIFKSIAEPGWLGIIGANEQIQRLVRIIGLERDDTVRLFSTRKAAERQLDLGGAGARDRERRRSSLPNRSRPTRSPQIGMGLIEHRT